MNPSKVNDRQLAASAILIWNERVLFLKRNNPPHFWAPPAGKVEISESIEEAVLREIKEESGIGAKILGPVEVWEGKPVDMDVLSITYVCTSDTNKVRLSREHSDYNWIPIEDLEKFNDYTDYDVKKWSSLIEAAQIMAKSLPLKVL